MRPTTRDRMSLEHFPPSVFSLGRSDSSHVHKWTTQHLSNVFFALDVRHLDVAPTKACIAIIPSMRLDFDEGSSTMCSSRTWLAVHESSNCSFVEQGADSSNSEWWMSRARRHRLFFIPAMNTDCMNSLNRRLGEDWHRRLSHVAVFDVYAQHLSGCWKAVWCAFAHHLLPLSSLRP